MQKQKKTAAAAAFEVKQKVVLSLNKLGDRDTYQLAAHELHQAALSLPPDALAPFLACILDVSHGPHHKPALRRECLALLATLLLSTHLDLSPHLPRILSALVRRLRDPEASVQDACVHTAAALASTLSGAHFPALLRPLFEALGEQHKQVQAGAALCLAALIPHAHKHTSNASLLHRMLLRTTKLLRNPHFLAKPALVELNAAIITATTTLHNVAAVEAIQECLKNSDWHTRKAASAALAHIALTAKGGPLARFRDSCIQSLESCRFDKVKPVRDSALHALHCWTNLPSQTASSSAQENFDDVTSASESASKDGGFTKLTAKPRIPLSVRRKMCPNPVELQESNKDDWHVCVQQLNNEDSECSSSVTKNFDITSMREDATGYDFVHMDDDKQDCSSISSFVTDKFDIKASRDREMRLLSEETCCEEQKYTPSVPIREDRASLDSTVTEAASRTVSSHKPRCCSQMANEIASIQKQLVEIENKQSNLLDLFQVFATGLRDNLGVLQSRVVRLENAVDDRYSLAMSKMMSSPRQARSDCTPRPSVDLQNRQPRLASVNGRRTRDPTMTFSSVSIWKRVRGFICEGDVESAYAEALCSGDELVVVELLESTGPVLQCLSSRNASAVLTTLAAFLMQQKFTSSLLPWLQQVVELNNGHGPKHKHVVVSTKARQRLLSALEEVVNMDFASPTEKRCLTQIAVKLHNIWGRGGMGVLNGDACI